ncbi:unnamed protein product [Linum trigynum]|uniref:Uncharacterized protein n=1 Tax=Linum trigynum TaxID=586398 RepID=A0AAV2E6F2_9ROSI
MEENAKVSSLEELTCGPPAIQLWSTKDDEEERLAEATSEASPEAPALPAIAQKKETSNTSPANTANEKEGTTEEEPLAVMEPLAAPPLAINATTPLSAAIDALERRIAIQAEREGQFVASFVNGGFKRISVRTVNWRLRGKDDQNKDL